MAESDSHPNWKTVRGPRSAMAFMRSLVSSEQTESRCPQVSDVPENLVESAKELALQALDNNDTHEVAINIVVTNIEGIEQKVNCTVNRKMTT